MRMEDIMETLFGDRPAAVKIDVRDILDYLKLILAKLDAIYKVLNT